MRYAPPRTLAALVAAAAATTAGGLGIAAQSAAATTHPQAQRDVADLSGYSGSAYGSQFVVGDTTDSGRSAKLSLNCTSNLGTTRRDASGQTTLKSVGKAAAVKTSTRTLRVKGGSEAVSQSRIEGLNALGGQLTAQTISSTATVVTKHGVARPKGKTTIAGLKLDGHAMSVPTGVDQKVTVPNLGTLTFNQQTADKSGGAGNITVNALTLRMPAGSTPGTTAPSALVLGHSRTGVVPLHVAALSGAAFGSQLQGSTKGNRASSNKTFEQPLPCNGSGGKTLQNRGSDSAIPHLLGTGNVTSKAHSSRHQGTLRGRTASRVDHASLLGGKIKARLLQAVATVTADGNGVKRSSAGTRIGGLVINGKSVAAPTTPNTKRTIAGVGTLWFDRVVKTKGGVAVHGLELVLSHAMDGAKAGAHLDVANATAKARR